MKTSITRRSFLKGMALTAALVTAGCAPQRDTQNGPVESKGKDVTKWCKGVCRYCGTGCGIYAGLDKAGKMIAVKGDPENPVNHGRLCIKGMTLPKILTAPDRVTKPLIKENGEFREASWDEALDLMASKFKEAIDQYGPDSVGFYGSGQTYAEETYTVQKVFRAGIGTNNVDGNPRTCMASAVAGMIATYGEDEPSGTYADIEDCDHFFMIGSNMAEAHPVLFARLVEAKRKNPDMKILVADVRETKSMAIADYKLLFQPSTDLTLLNAMAYVILEDGLQDDHFIENHVNFMQGKDKIDLAKYKEFLADYAPEKAEAACGIPADTIRMLTHEFYGKDAKTMSVWCMGFNQRIAGVFVNNLIHNLHLLTGKICKPGSTPFSLTGQPSACGSVRETGGLSHILPAHRFVANEKHRAQLAEIWGVDPSRMPSKPGYHTIAMFEAACTGKLKCLWVMTTNPGQSLPNADHYREGMEKTFMVVSEAYHPTRTSELADIVLPSAMWMEKTGIFGNGERRTQYLDGQAKAPGEAKPDFWQICEFAKRMGYEDLVFKTPEDAWKEYQKCQEGTAMTLASYDHLKKAHGVLWPVSGPEEKETRIRYAREWDPNVSEDAPDGIEFYGKPDGRAVIWARPQVFQKERPDAEYPFCITTGRMLEHWHTGTMTFNVPELKRIAPEMVLDMNEGDAARLGIQDGDTVKVISRRATLTVKAAINGRSKPEPGVVYMSFHDPAMERMVNRVMLDFFDPGSKQPDYKASAVRIEKA
ncbi:MAG: molybdopterin-dependent oxidoreductase [Selenomonadaceae bacterium]|nr:molybdopterin-dependent oxidoreductase [Selenomonadaceae bacterium]